jgi:hypothetical protein
MNLRETSTGAFHLRRPHPDRDPARGRPRARNKHLEHIYRKLEVTGRQQAIDTVFS